MSQCDSNWLSHQGSTYEDSSVTSAVYTSKETRNQVVVHLGIALCLDIDRRQAMREPRDTPSHIQDFLNEPLSPFTVCASCRS